ncbi:MFS transporter [Chloroflexota bacterium]
MSLLGFFRKRHLFYGWVIVAICLATMTASYVAFYSWPVFYVAIIGDFGWGRAETALIFSVAVMTYGFASPVSGFLFDRLGPRKLFTTGTILIASALAISSRATEVWHLSLFYGLLVGLGVSLNGFIPSSTLISTWFRRRRSTALGIAQMGTRDTFLLAPLIQLLILAVGWRNSYLVLAAAAVIIIIPSTFFLRTRPQDIGALPDGDASAKGKPGQENSEADLRGTNPSHLATEWTLRRAMKKYEFWALFSTMLGSGLVFSAMMNHFVALITDIGYDVLFAANLLLVFGVATLVGRASGFISDLIGRELTCTGGLAANLLALMLLLYAYTNGAAPTFLLYIAALGYGFGSGIWTPVYASAVADIFQGENLGAIIGAINIGFGVSSSVGTWLFGFLFDIYGTYTPSIIIANLAVVMICAAIWIAAPRRFRQTGSKAY